MCRWARVGGLKEESRIMRVFGRVGGEGVVAVGGVGAGEVGLRVQMT